MPTNSHDSYLGDKLRASANKDTRKKKKRKGVLEAQADAYAHKPRAHMGGQQQRRARQRGYADQIAHEAREEHERKQLKARLRRQNRG